LSLYDDIVPAQAVSLLKPKTQDLLMVQPT
jgi:hypothetical protein